jgi:hypothetical protein
MAISRPDLRVILAIILLLFLGCAKAAPLAPTVEQHSRPIHIWHTGDTPGKALY